MHSMPRRFCCLTLYCILIFLLMSWVQIACGPFSPVMGFCSFSSSVSLVEISASGASRNNSRRAPWHWPCSRDIRAQWEMWPYWREHSSEHEWRLHEDKIHHSYTSLFLIPEWVITSISAFVSVPVCPPTHGRWECFCNSTFHSLLTA